MYVNDAEHIHDHEWLKKLNQEYVKSLLKVGKTVYRNQFNDLYLNEDLGEKTYEATYNEENHLHTRFWSLIPEAVAVAFRSCNEDLILQQFVSPSKTTIRVIDRAENIVWRKTVQI